MNGYPIVYFDHYEVAMPMGGVSSNDTSVAPTSVEVAPGGTAQAAITITQAGFVDGCDVVTTQALLVAPPITHPFEWSTDAQHVNTGDVSACSNDDISLITVGAITAG